MGSNIYAFELPTTGSLSFSDHVTNGLDIYATQISGATQARANLRAVLKESKHTDGDKDYLRLVKVCNVIQLLSQGHISPFLKDTRRVPPIPLRHYQLSGKRGSAANSGTRYARVILTLIVTT